ncbi:MAG TPA: molybdenum cofactor biosynthesis protein MoaE, partial [Thermoplasmata archaeon]|nr:molybdenum cofactor biosynthesis protein MoaE [Thermoplasmata archaeon]
SVRLTPERLDVAEAVRELSRNEGGAWVVFAGRVRPDRVGSRRVRSLVYEADERMAIPAMERIARRAGAARGMLAVVLWHRTGTLPVGEVSVIVGAAAGHRAQAFRAARGLIEHTKSDVPIWKSAQLLTKRRHSAGRATK